MRVVIAPNSFKHCLAAPAVGAALARGVRAVYPRAVVQIMPMSDGGDGLLTALRAQRKGPLMVSPTRDPLGRPIRAAWLKTGSEALLEMALASGLALLPDRAAYAPLQTSSYGTGLLIRAALDQGCRKIILGLGGSATVDAGCGLAKALGFRLYDRRGRSIPDGGGGLSRLARIRHDTADPRLSTTSFIALADVQNPLLGPNGAAPVFAPQKGANAVEVLRLERNLLHWHRIIQRTWGLDVASANGAGAAGGLGAGCLAFLGAQLIPGAQWVAEQIGLAKAIGRADLVLTGEGRLDRQTLAGKGPALVARLARVHRKPVIAVAGAVADRARLRSLGLTRCLAITPPGMAQSEAFAQAETNLEKTAAALMMAFRR